MLEGVCVCVHPLKRISTCAVWVADSGDSEEEEERKKREDEENRKKKIGTPPYMTSGLIESKQ